MVKIKKAEYILSAAWKSQWPKESFPEMCLAGRSNVGKSSFINTMLSRNGLAKVSSTPGKTKTLNFFNVNDALYFVDVPGYGYASVSKKEQKKFGLMIEEYLEKRENLKRTFLLVDLRHKPSEDDILMYNFLKYYNLPVTIIATKADKIATTKREKHKKLIIDTLKLKEEDNIFLFSSETTLGKEPVLKYLDELLNLNENKEETETL